MSRAGKQNGRRACKHDERPKNCDSVLLVQMQSDIGHGLNSRTPLHYLSRGELPNPPPPIHILIHVELHAANCHPTKAHHYKNGSEHSHPFPHVAERPKLSDPAHGTLRLQPRRSRRVRCSAWLGITFSTVGLPANCLARNQTSVHHSDERPKRSDYYPSRSARKPANLTKSQTMIPKRPAANLPP